MTKSPRETLSGIRGWMSIINEAIDPDQATVDQAAADAVLEDTPQAAFGDDGGSTSSTTTSTPQQAFGEPADTPQAAFGEQGDTPQAAFGESKSFRDYLALVEGDVAGGDQRKVDSKTSRDDDTPGKDEPVLPGVIENAENHQKHDRALGEYSIRGWMNVISEATISEDDGDTVTSGDGPTGETTATVDSTPSSSTISSGDGPTGETTATVDTTPTASTASTGGDYAAASDAGNGNSSVADAGAASDAGNGNGSVDPTPGGSTPTAASPFASGTSAYASHGVTGATPDNPSTMTGGSPFTSGTSAYNSYGATGAAPTAGADTTGSISKPAAAAPAAGAGGERTYTVQKGDTLSGIAKAQTGDGSRSSYMKMAADSGIKNPDMIQPGQQIKIGGGSAAAPAAQAAPRAAAPAAAAPAAPAAAPQAAASGTGGVGSDSRYGGQNSVASAPSGTGGVGSDSRYGGQNTPAPGGEGARVSDAANRGRAPSTTGSTGAPASAAPAPAAPTGGASVRDAANRWRRA